ncbi:MAG: glycoside hydrolase family 130 protein [Saprospiraceae bacterium]|nr:glycoside hydrolase family 130 protein [Saprospiraceae bacterium]MCF8250972.1 glycoside hydrolase family 130 protein [Saprospiraceae bacterium]MCF8280301.1 glycoside hydrolase family 130 protein [Bacteroidales bacterium]MCF8312828.1 glycoside hydrolase family 130 protein [Saprospiraceae bacterium]MCF8441275.1 glycoside hydrolase family 130 protein [Saprospiraceae bacterium]
MPKRFTQNPILSTKDIQPSQPGLVVECVLNPGVFSFNGKTWLLLRVAERPVQKEGIISFPVMNVDGSFIIKEFEKTDPDLDLSDARMVTYKGTTYLSTISHLRLVCSDDGIHFYEPKDHQPTSLFGTGYLETFGIEDSRVSMINGVYHLTYTQVSENGVGVGLMRTTDWENFTREGMILPPHNKDCALFEEKINDKYYCLHRPSGVGLGGNFIWMATSNDLLHWGNHHCLLHTRPGMWDSARVGAGAAPIKTDEGWLCIYHGADANNRYCLGAILLDLKDPTKVLSRSQEPLMEPTAAYEKTGFFGNVVFTNGHLVDGDEITMYYGASDEVICGAKLSIEKILNLMMNDK